ncbi:MAG: ZIP family metal transporter [Nitrospira sp. CR1.3]|nr:ZIP family metal transporter [Nitrospira sp. CR1.3]
MSLPVESSWGFVVLMGLLGSLGALVPAAAVLFVPDGWRHHAMPYLLSYATGTMLATAIIGLIPEALEHISIYEAGISLLAGLVLFFVLEWTVIWRHSHGDDQEDHHDHGLPHAHTSGMAKQTGMLVLIGDAVHNTADGIAIGVACVASPGLGLVTTLAVLGHEVPQELSDFTILLSSGFSRWKAFMWNTLSGLGTLAGVVAAYGGLGYAEAIVPYALSMAAASFLYIGLADLVPGLHGRVGAAKGVWQFTMMIAGMVTVGALTMLPH